MDAQQDQPIDLSPTQRKQIVYGILSLILVGGLFIRLLFFLQIQKTPLASEFVAGADSNYYLNWSSQLTLSHDPIEGVYFMSPLYPYFLKGIFTLFGTNLNDVRVLQHLLGLATILLTFWIGRSLAGNAVGYIAVLFLTFSAVMVFYEGQILMASLLLFLNTLFLYLIIEYRTVSLFYGAFLPGFLVGFAAIGRGIVLLFIPFILLSYYTQSQNRRKLRPFWNMVLFSVGVSLAIIPVTLRNYSKENEFTLLTSNLGLNFYIGNNPQAHGMYERPSVIQFIPGKLDEDIEGRRYVEKIMGFGLTSGQVSDYWFTQGLEIWRRDIRKALANYIHKLWLFWNSSEIPQIENLYFYQTEYTPMLKYCFLSFSFLGPCCILGLYWGLRHRKMSLIVLLVIIYASSIALFFITSRYRLPVLSYLSLLGGYGLVSLYRFGQSRDMKKVGLSVVLLLGSFCLFYAQPFDMNFMKAQQYNQFGFLYFKHGLYDQARAMYDKAITYDPYYHVAYRNLGDIYHLQHDPSKAMAYYQRALQINPEDAVAHYNIGLLYQKEGKLPEAERRYRDAIRFDPTFSAAYNNLALLLQHQGDLNNALLTYEKAISSDLRNHQALNNLGILVLKLGLLEEAARLFQRAYQENPDEIRYHVNWAITLSELDHNEPALRELVEIQHKIQDDFELEQKIMKYIVLTLYDLEQYEDAASRAQDFLGRYPQSDTIQQLLIQLPDRTTHQQD